MQRGFSRILFLFFPPCPLRSVSLSSLSSSRTSIPLSTSLRMLHQSFCVHQAQSGQRQPRGLPESCRPATPGGHCFLLRTLHPFSCGLSLLRELGTFSAGTAPSSSHCPHEAYPPFSKKCCGALVTCSCEICSSAL